MANETTYLERFTENLTSKVASDPQKYTIYGRDKEFHRLLVILNQEIQNSPVLVGEAGVGKSAIAEMLALELAIQPEKYGVLGGMQILSLQMATLMGQNAGEFAQNFEGVLKEILANRDKYLLFIDEVHTIVGTGSANGSAVDAGNMLKPALGRGEIRVIGATTLPEYHDYIETDAALTRRFAAVQVDELTVEDTTALLTKIKGRFEMAKGISIPDNILPEITRLAGQYDTTRYYPEKAIMLLDAAVSTASLAGNGELTLSEVRSVISDQFGVPLTVLNEAADTRLQSLEDKVKKRVIGQDEAIHHTVGRIRAREAGLGDMTKPLSIWYGGPTGVGKTETAKAIAECLFGSEEAMIRFDMSEFKAADSNRNIYEKFRSRLTREVQFKPYSLLLFDETEKAASDVLDLLLQVLDDGRLTDEYGRVINFKDTIILFTSNIGHKLIEERSAKSEEFRKDKRRKATFEDEYEMAMLGANLRQEFISRLGAKVIFEPLDKSAVLQIIDLKLSRLAKQTEASGYHLIYKPEEVAQLIPTFMDHYEEDGSGHRLPSWPINQFIMDEGYRPSRGVRPIDDTIFEAVESVIADAILSDRISNKSNGNTFMFRAFGVAPDKTHPHGDWHAVFTQFDMSKGQLEKLEKGELNEVQTIAG
ncbi:ATP-dependent Clp protease ATP-binding subunit [Weissella confusa]|uniref:AAA family ATPase n=1 Tax=Weissella confusa TaxID=1583 RepID=UPI001C6FC1D3|nr:ATP-dependent Clp protease ATP-binding subunit [Weissella confusa]QYU57987.1 ATP-dependent Clp protease ATP-binding subunit [Weissella confusa]